MPCKLSKTRGFTLLELIVSIGIFGIISLGIGWILITSFRSNAVLWEQLATQTDGRRVIREVTDDVRRAEDSSVGSYLIEAASDEEFIFFANIDADSERERIRFFLDGELFKKGVMQPSGSPLSYNGEEKIVTIATDVKNTNIGVPIFSYFDKDYTGTEDALSSPVSITAIRVVKVQLELEEDPTQTPVPLHVESLVHIRNLKDEG